MRGEMFKFLMILFIPCFLSQLQNSPPQQNRPFWPFCRSAAKFYSLEYVLGSGVRVALRPRQTGPKSSIFLGRGVLQLTLLFAGIPTQPGKLAFGLRENSRESTIANGLTIWTRLQSSIPGALAQPKCQLSRLCGYKFDEHLERAGEDFQYIRTPEDRKLLGFFSALFDMAQRREKPAGSIPKTLHFIWLGPQPFPRRSVKKIKKWIDLHPGWKIKFWTDLGQAAPDDRMEVYSFELFPLQELKECYYRCDNFGERSEILRYAILLNEGGIYIDHDVQCLKAIHLLQEAYDFFCGLDPLGPTVLSSSVNPSPHLIASTAQHPILKASKKWLINEWDSLEMQYTGLDSSAIYNRVQHRSFRALGVGIKDAHNRAERKDAVFPPDFFSLSDRKKAIYAVHQHKGSWYKQKTAADCKAVRLVKEIKREFSRTFALVVLLLFVNVGLSVLLYTPRTPKL
jgi:hypothetical protein